MTTTLRCALVGTGAVTNLHTQAVAAHPHAELVAVTSLDRSVADDFAERSHVPAVYDDLDELLAFLLGEWAGVQRRLWRLDRETETEDASTATVTFVSGVVAQVVTSAVSPRETNSIRVDTQKATITVEHLDGHGHENWSGGCSIRSAARPIRIRGRESRGCTAAASA